MIKNKFIFSASILPIFVTNFCIYPAVKIGEKVRIDPGYNKDLHELGKIAQLEHGYNITNATGDVRYNQYFAQTLLNKFASDNDYIHTSKMLHMGADANSFDGDGEQALNAAVKCRNLKMVKLLLDGGANFNIINRRGFYRFVAISKVDIPMLEFLIKNDAEVNIVNIEDKTILIDVIEMATKKLDLTERQALKIIELLIDAGADINKKDDSGKDALYYAKKNKVVSAFLKEYSSEKEMLTMAQELNTYLPIELVGVALSYLPSFKKYEEVFEKHKESKLVESVAPSSCVNCAIL